MIQRLPIIINPSAGPERPVLSILNRAFDAAGVDWDVFVTKRAGDARRYAEQALASGAEAVGVYGGDGTVMEAASALIGTDVPLAILPGGTANVIATELGIPNDLGAACALLVNGHSTVRALDVGQVEDQYFLVRVGMGFEAQMVAGAERSLKERVGALAYFVAAVRALADPAISCYHLLLDGQSIEVEGLTCIIANAGSFGALPLTIAPSIDVTDGQLDVVLVQRADLPGLLEVAASILAGTADARPLLCWRVREVTVVADPPQTVQVDGEVWGQTPITARVIPHAVRVLVPAVCGSRS